MMKKLNIILLLSLFIGCLISCSSDDDTVSNSGDFMIYNGSSYPLEGGVILYQDTKGTYPESGGGLRADELSLTSLPAGRAPCDSTFSEASFGLLTRTKDSLENGTYTFSPSPDPTPFKIYYGTCFVNFDPCYKNLNDYFIKSGDLNLSRINDSIYTIDFNVKLKNNAKVSGHYQGPLSHRYTKVNQSL